MYQNTTPIAFSQQTETKKERHRFCSKKQKGRRRRPRTRSPSRGGSPWRAPIPGTTPASNHSQLGKQNPPTPPTGTTKPTRPLHVRRRHGQARRSTGRRPPPARAHSSRPRDATRASNVRERANSSPNLHSAGRAAWKSKLGINPALLLQVVASFF
jgi:hypothetical protein